jgi:hypothetical protein
MEHRMTALERAFQLARSGRVSTIADIVGSLKRARPDRRSRVKASACESYQSRAGGNLNA